MTEEKKQETALMRYAIIAPLVAGLSTDYASNREFFLDAARKGAVRPDGKVIHYSPDTIERWYLHYKKDGFSSLLPSARSDSGKSRVLDDDIQEQIRHLKLTYPRMTSAAICRLLHDSGSAASGEVSESTVNRFVKQLMAEQRLSGNRDMRRYERAHINEVWCGDSSVGPRLADGKGQKHRVYIIALIDDASRFILAASAFYNDSFVNLMAVIRSAVSRAGVPRVFNFDNGKNYRNRQMELLAARIGSTLHYCEPYTPTSKSKIERWFRTMKDQWMAALDMREIHSLEELNASLHAYVRRYNQTVHSSLNGSCPQDRFFSEPEQVRRLSEEQIGQDFLLEIDRRVSPDSVIIIDRTEYEVDCRFARQRIRLRYSADMEEIFVVEADGSLTPIRLLNKQENASVKREKVHLAGGES